MLAHELAVKVELVETPWKDLIPDLVDGKTDVVMSGLSITPERQKLVSFTDSYGNVGQMALLRFGDYELVKKSGFPAKNVVEAPRGSGGGADGTSGAVYGRRECGPGNRSVGGP
jgi:cyclohexadienyl dehydratase